MTAGAGITAGPGCARDPSGPFDAACSPLEFDASACRSGGGDLGVPADLAPAPMVDSGVADTPPATGIQLAPPVPWPTGPGPYGIAAGDFDGDGDLDLATGDYEDRHVTVLYNDGRAGFRERARFAAGPRPLWLAASRLEPNGHVDLIVSLAWGSGFVVLRGRGDGTFGEPVPYPMREGAGRVVVADLNDDGHPDVIAAHSDGQKEMWTFLNQRDGTLAPLEILPAPDVPGIASIAAGDLDGDGHLDLLAGNEERADLYIFRGVGGGLMGPPTVDTGLPGPADLVLRDFTGDGVLDLFVADWLDENVVLLKGSGRPDMAFSLHSYYPTSKNDKVRHTDLDLADFDGDGIDDIVVANLSDRTISVLRGEPRERFGVPRPFWTGVQPNRFAVGDLDGDGRPDVAVAGGSTGDEVVVLRNLTVAP